MGYPSSSNGYKNIIHDFEEITQHFIMVPNALLADNTVTYADIALWCALKTFYNPDEDGTITLEMLGFMTGMSATSMSRKLDELVAAGWGFRLDRVDKEGHYRITVGVFDEQKEKEPEVRGFTKIPEAIVKNPNLSLIAKGVMIQLLSFDPNRWSTGLNDLSRRHKGDMTGKTRGQTGKTRIRKALTELDYEDYITLSWINSAGGRGKYFDIQIHDRFGEGEWKGISKIAKTPRKFRAWQKRRISYVPWKKPDGKGPIAVLAEKPEEVPSYLQYTLRDWLGDKMNGIPYGKAVKPEKPLFTEPCFDKKEDAVLYGKICDNWDKDYFFEDGPESPGYTKADQLVNNVIKEQIRYAVDRTHHNKAWINGEYKDPQQVIEALLAADEEDVKAINDRLVWFYNERAKKMEEKKRINWFKKMMFFQLFKRFEDSGRENLIPAKVFEVAY